MLTPACIQTFATPRVPMSKCCSLRQQSYSPPDKIKSSSSSSSSSSSFSSDLSGHVAEFATSGKGVNHNSKAASARSWKKPEGKPKRPLSAYNFFFQHRRAVVIAALKPTDICVENEDLQRQPTVAASAHSGEKTTASKRKRRSRGIGLGFAYLARDVAKTWKALHPEARQEFEELAKKDKERYEAELVVWTDKVQEPHLVRESLEEQFDERDDVRISYVAHNSYSDDSYFSCNSTAPRDGYQDHRQNGHMMPCHHQQQKQFFPPIDETSIAAIDCHALSPTRLISRNNSREDYGNYHSSATCPRQHESSRKLKDHGQQEKRDCYRSDPRPDLSDPEAFAPSSQRYLHDKQNFVSRPISHSCLSLAKLKREESQPIDTRNATFDDPALCILPSTVRVSPELSAWAQNFMGQDNVKDCKKLKDVDNFLFYNTDDDWTTSFLNLASSTSNEMLPPVKEEEHYTLPLSKSSSSHDLFSSKAITALYEEESAWFTGIGVTSNPIWDISYLQTFDKLAKNEPKA